MPAEESGFAPATTAAPQFTYLPYRGIDSTLNYPPIPPRGSSQTQHEPLSASSRYSQASPGPGPFSTFPSPEADTQPFIPRLSEIASCSTADSSSSLLTTIAVPAPAPAPSYPRAPNPYHGPQLNAYTAHPLKSHPFMPDRASSEPIPQPPRPHISRFSSVSPTSPSNPSHRSSDQPTQDYRSSRSQAASPAHHPAPLPLLLQTRYAGSGAAPRPVEQGLVRDLKLGYGFGVDAYGMRRDPTYWSRARQGGQGHGQQGRDGGQEQEQEQRSVVGTVVSGGTSGTGRTRRKLQKRRRSDDGQGRGGHWMSW